LELLAIIEALISIDADWVPSSTPQCAASLYIRPALIATDATLELSSPKAAKLYVITGPVGAYFQTGLLQPVTVLADPSVARSFPGGVGGYKMGWLDIVKIGQNNLYIFGILFIKIIQIYFGINLEF
jgi:branched-chain amino acid aminotransferase